MKGIILAALGLGLAIAARTGRAQSTAPAAQFDPAKPTAKTAEPVAVSQKGEIAVGEIFTITLPCNPTTGFGWELKSINRRVAVATGPAEYQKGAAAPGMLGAGGACIVRVKGVKPGKTKAILVYRRSWEKVEPAKTVAAEITVVPAKTP
jgi:inhibitor of cysteine peptidase